MNKAVYQQPIGLVMQSYQYGGTGDTIPTIIGCKGLSEKYDMVTISLSSQYIGIPILTILTGRSRTRKETSDEHEHIQPVSEVGNQENTAKS